MDAPARRASRLTVALSVVLAGGGTAGHVEPALAVADALRRHDPASRLTLLGAQGGLEERLVPARGFDLRLIPRVPLPRRISTDLARLPGRVAGAVSAAGRVLDDVEADVVVGFGGYVAFPAYVAARRRRIPIVVHEANARPGVANRVGARVARRVAVGFPGTPLARAEVVGLPLRPQIAALDRAARRDEAARAFGLDPARVTVLAFGGSLGAATLNATVPVAASAIADAGGQVLLATGRGREAEARANAGAGIAEAGRLVLREYLDRMDDAYAAADIVVCRAGAMTVAEVTAVGLPAVFVPLPIGNGEQRLNAAPVVAAGGAFLLDDSDCTPESLQRLVLPLVDDEAARALMGRRAAGFGRLDADEAVATMVRDVAARAADEGEGRR